MLFHEFYIYIFSVLFLPTKWNWYFFRECDLLSQSLVPKLDLERYNDSSDLFIVQTHLCRHTFIIRKDKCYRQEISERCKVGQYFLTNFLNFSATHHSRWKESLFVTDIFLLSCVHFVILFPTCKKVCVRCYTCLWAYFYFYKWQNPFYDRVTF